MGKVIKFNLISKYFHRCFLRFRVRVRAMVSNATFNNISVIWWRSVLLVEDTGVPWENNRPAANHFNIHLIYTNTNGTLL